MRDIRKIQASATVSELQNQSSDSYMTIIGKLCDTTYNKNNVRVTEGFIDEIVTNEEKYRCIPLCADVRGLLTNSTIGHMYDQTTGEFHSQVIGAMDHFSKTTDDDGNSSLIISVRAYKRFPAVCRAITSLFADNRLKFSFEVSCGEYTEDEDGRFTIDASPYNYLEGAAIVTFPACPDAIAMELIAECMTDGGNTIAANQGDDDMQNEERLNASTSETLASSEETTECAVVNSELYVHHEHTEVDEISTYDTETGIESVDVITQHNCVSGPVKAEDGSVASDAVKETAAVSDDDADSDDSDEKKEEPDDKEKTAEVQTAADNKEDDVDPEKEDDEEEMACDDKKQCAEQTDVVAELTEQIKALAQEIDNLKFMLASKEEPEPQNEAKEIVSEITSKWTLLSPFTDNIDLPQNSKYSLLQEDKAYTGPYTLI